MIGPKSPRKTAAPSKKGRLGQWWKTQIQNIKKSLKKNWETGVYIALASTCILSIFLTTTPESEKENLEKWLITTPTSFSPTSKDRTFWTNLPVPPPAYIPDKKDINTLTPPDLAWKLYHGTPTAAMAPNTPWEQTLNQVLLRLCQIPWSQAYDPSLPLPPEPINLTTTQIAANMAATIRILGPQLPKPTVEKVRQTLNERILTPYLKESQRFQNSGKSYELQTFWIGTKDNWSAVCLANIAYTGLAINPKNENIELLEAVLRDIPPYLESFDKDGYFPGGIRYWEYGFGHFVLLNEILIHATNGKINYYKDPKIREAIHFPMKTLIALGKPDGAKTPTKHLNFGDNDGLAYANRWIWDILNKRYKTNYSIPPQLIPNLWYPSLPILDLLLNPPKTKLIDETRQQTTDTYYPESGVLIARTESGELTLATKGNHNKEENMHNHNDVGSYTVFHLGRYLTGDPGGGDYENAFGPDRYKRDTESSWGHPVPVIDNQLQSNGEEFYARVLQIQTDENKSKILYDLSNAYQVPDLKTLQREITFDKKTYTVTIRDSFESNRPMHLESPIIQGLNIKNTNLPAIQVKTSGPYKIKESYPQGTQEFGSIRRVGIELDKTQTGWVQYTIKPRKKTP